MNISLISKITLATFTASITSLIITPAALAYTFSLSGVFDDGGTLSGTFDYEETTDIFNNNNITTTGGTTLSGTNYTGDLAIGNSSGFTITDDGFEFDLTLDFVSALSSTSGAISLDTSTQEEDFLGTSRLLTSGTVSPVAVPFEPSANLAIFTILGLMGVNRYRKTCKY